MHMDNFIKEAQFYEKLKDKKAKCLLCPHRCEINDNSIGKCRVRKNIEGELVTLNYGKIAANNLDPIEKKPLYHFHPGKNIFSIGSFGCNLKCSFCQNHSIAHGIPQSIESIPEKIVEFACRQADNIGVAYTYNEPSIWYEFVLDTAKLIKEKGKKNVIVSNGYISKEPLLKLIPYIDAMNIDLKAFSNEFYDNICKGRLNPVLDTITMAKKSCHIEITTLLIEGLNTKEEEIIELSKWVASIDENIPLHLSKYYPAYKMNSPATSVEKIIELYNIAKEYLNYVYIGNVYGTNNNTYCPSCKTLIIERDFKTQIKNLTEGQCDKCNKEIEIII